MPNWCENVVTVSGEKKELDSFKKFVKGTCTISTECIRQPPNANEAGNWETVTLKTPKTVEIPFSFKSILPYADKWDYNWCVDNWGVKWDLDNETRVDEEDEYIEYCFDTAWGPPYGIHQTLTTLYPKLHITWFYHEPMMEVAGYLNKEVAVTDHKRLCEVVGSLSIKQFEGKNKQDQYRETINTIFQSFLEQT